ncbi:MAG: C40 family peptidase [Treponemataceae bacterium]|nr:C40 family peptidase [Treponemataceae bacterium]
MSYRCLSLGTQGKKLSAVFIVFISLLFSSCNNQLENPPDNQLDNQEGRYTIINASAQIAERAYSFAELYDQTETEYRYGGQDPLRIVGIDCSGLVIMCYKYALVDTKYLLLVSDMTADYMYKNASSPVGKNEMRRGDLIFMGEAGNNGVSHIALFDKLENGNIYFIDSTRKDSDGDGIDDINGVTYRHYPEDDTRFKAFGVMKIKY